VQSGSLKYKNDENGAALWIKALGNATHSYVIPTSKGSDSSFDVIQENPPSDAEEPTFT